MACARPQTLSPVGAAALLLTACGSYTGPHKSDPTAGEPELAAAPSPDASDLTPGFFRDLHLRLQARSALDDAAAVAQITDDYVAYQADPGPLPGLLPLERDTLDGLLLFGLRAVQVTTPTKPIARKIGTTGLQMILGLDPALDTFNNNGGSAKVTAGGGKTLATAARLALRDTAEGAPACQSAAYASAAAFDAGAPTAVWVAEVCEPDAWVGGYCEQDVWLDGQCYDEWVPEVCTNGEYVDDGYWEYTCYSSDDCRDVWRSVWVWVDGTCTAGYYDHWCDSGHWEPGVCYDGTFVPGYCQPGHYEFHYPDGVWTFAAVTAPAGCDTVRPRQYTIARYSIETIAATVRADLLPLWQGAVDAFLRDASTAGSDEATYDAAVQILDGIAE